MAEPRGPWGFVALQGSPSWQNLGAAERRAQQGSPSWRNLGGPQGYGWSGWSGWSGLVFLGLVWFGLVAGESVLTEPREQKDMGHRRGASRGGASVRKVGGGGEEEEG